jgi:hypothetical protein
MFVKRLKAIFAILLKGHIKMPLTQATQVAIAQTATAQRLPSLPFNNQFVPVILRAAVGNEAKIVIGSSSAVTSTTGFPLEAGAQVPVALVNADALWILGTVGDLLSIIGS